MGVKGGGCGRIISGDRIAFAHLFGRGRYCRKCSVVLVDSRLQMFV